MTAGPAQTGQTQPDEIELSITTVAKGQYFIQLRHRRAGVDTETQAPLIAVPLVLPAELTGPASLDLTAQEYGALLEEAVFADAEMRSAMDQALGCERKALRLRIFSNDPAVQTLRWETLLFHGQPLFADGICLSRYLSPLRPGIQTPLRSALKALVFVASPSNIGRTPNPDAPGYDPRQPPDRRPHLDPIDCVKEWTAAKNHLTAPDPASPASIAVTADYLGSPGDGTLDKLMSKLDEGYDILYLICHGSIGSDDGPCLYMEDAAGNTKVEKAGDFAARLLRPPRLIVLASCQSAGTGDASKDAVIASKNLSAFGPLLARAGAPAVIAMQGFITIATAEAFSCKLFSELRRDGQVDRAVAEARSSVFSAGRGNDYWMPVLFSSSRSGSLFHPYVPGFEQSGLASEAPPWANIVSNIQMGHCIPVLGPDCLEPIWGSTRDISAWLAQNDGFPLEEHLRENLPAVAQYLQYKNGSRNAFYDSSMIEYLKDQWRNPDIVPPVWDILEAAGRKRRAGPPPPEGPEDIHRLLARMRFTLYFTASPDHLLEDALTEAKRSPRWGYARWKPELCDKSKFGKPQNYQPTEEEPFVYHLFGSCKEPSSLVITEDDYFDYMLGINTKESIAFTPPFIKAPLEDSALLFLGFHFQDDGFRIVFRKILAKIDAEKKNVWVGAQIPPDRDRFRQVEAARTYIDKTLGGNQLLKIYWGNTQDFIEEFSREVRNQKKVMFEPAVANAAPKASAGAA
jgi:hypothetical protein